MKKFVLIKEIGKDAMICLAMVRFLLKLMQFHVDMIMVQVWGIQ